MPRMTGPALPAGVKLLRKRIDLWRRTRDRRTAMPADLWVEAVALARPGRGWAVARALRVNFQALQRRIAETAPGAPGPGAATGTFVELSGAQILGRRAGGKFVQARGAAGPDVGRADGRSDRRTRAAGSK